MTSILVTGGAGYIGSHTCKALHQAGFMPVAYDNISRGNAEAVRWGPLEIGDLTDGARLREAIGRHRPAAVVHFAALAYVGESNLIPDVYHRNNVEGTATLVDAMRDSGIGKIVFSSSCTVYGTPERVPIVEDTPCAPVNPYGITKLACERMLRECTFPMSFMALRYFNAAGADPDGEIGECHIPETHAIPLVLEAAMDAAKGFTIFGDDYPTADGTCIRDYIHVSDLADAHVAALRALMDRAESTVLNLGSGHGHSVCELIDTAREVTGREIAVRVGPRRAGDPPILIADAARARGRLGWEPRRSGLATLVKHAWAWRQSGVKAWKRMRQAQPA